MPERWEHEIRKLRKLDAPEDLRARALEGPRGEPGRPPRERLVAAAVALAVFVGSGAFVLRTFAATEPADRTPSGTGTDELVIEVSSGNPPRASIRYGDQVVDGVRGGYEWCDAGGCVSGTADFAFYPPVNEYVVVPPGTPIEVQGDGTIDGLTWTLLHITGSPDEPTAVDGWSVPSRDAVYALEIDPTWEPGSAKFFFGIQVLSSPSEAPDVLGVDCSAGVARVDTAVVRTQPNGLHVSITGMDGYRMFWIVAPEGTLPDESSAVGSVPERVGGSLPERGDRPWGIPPGRWEVGCGGNAGPGDGTAPFELIDPDDHAAPDLTCEGATDERFTSTVPSSTRHGDAAASVVGGLADGDRLREGGYGAETFKLGPTYVIDRNGEAVARLVLSGDAQTYSGTLTTCPDTGIRLSKAAMG